MHGHYGMKDAVILSSDDRNRMTRLYEEVLTRLEEMAMITGRTLKLNGVGSEVQFNPVTTDERRDSKAVQIVRTPHTSGCYDYEAGVCFERDVRTVIGEISWKGVDKV
jgi:hypothetical protein